MGVPQNLWFVVEHPLKQMIWGYPHFRKPPNRKSNSVPATQSSDSALQGFRYCSVHVRQRHRVRIWKCPCRCTPRPCRGAADPGAGANVKVCCFRWQAHQCQGLEGSFSSFQCFPTKNVLSSVRSRFRTKSPHIGYVYTLPFSMLTRPLNQSRSLLKLPSSILGGTLARNGRNVCVEASNFHSWRKSRMEGPRMSALTQWGSQSALSPIRNEVVCRRPWSPVLPQKTLSPG